MHPFATTLAALAITILILNRRTFPLAFILLYTNVLNFSYGMSAELFSFRGGVIQVRDYFLMLIIWLIVRRVHLLKKRIAYWPLFLIIAYLLTIAAIASSFFGFNINVMVKMIRVLSVYIVYIYLAIYLMESRRNLLTFARTLYILVILAFSIQLLEIFLQRRISLEFIANPKNVYYTEGRYLTIPVFGKVLYSWNRMLSLMPMAVFFSGYFYLKKIRVLPVSNLVVFVMAIASYWMGLSRISIFMSTIMLMLFIMLNFRRGTILRTVILTIFIMSLVGYFWIDSQSAVRNVIMARIMTVSEISRGEGANTVGRINMWKRQITNIADSPIIGKGYSLASYRTLTGDLAISNLAAFFGVNGLLFPFYIIFRSYKGAIRISRFDWDFAVAFFAVFTALMMGSLFTADIYFFGSISSIQMMALVAAREQVNDWWNDEGSEAKPLIGSARVGGL